MTMKKNEEKNETIGKHKLKKKPWAVCRGGKNLLEHT